MVLFTFSLVYEVKEHSLHTPADQHSWHCNIYFLL